MLVSPEKSRSRRRGAQVPSHTPRHVPFQTDFGLACMDLGKGVRALKSGSVLSPFSVITLITSDLAVTAMQTSHFQAALEGREAAPASRPPPSFPITSKISLGIVSSPINIHK